MPSLRPAVGQSALESFVLVCYLEPHESVLVTLSSLLNFLPASETKIPGPLLTSSYCLSVDAAHPYLPVLL